jgi:ABC-type nitrate/sulfonate/bicarbonate transport system substrate-binding protein
MRRLGFLAALLLAGCATATPRPPASAAKPPPKPKPLAQILQDEGTNPMFVPMYLMAPDGTFKTNGLTPEPWGDTH